MLIKDVTKHTGLSPDTLRYYEKEGLIKPNRSTNGYRQYDDNVVLQLNMIQRAKNLGFSLKEIQELTGLLFANQLTQKEMAKKLLEKRANIEQKIAELTAIRNEIDDAMAGRCGYRQQLPQG